MINKIGLGGSCHWCTEAIFQSLKGVHRVEQGWISAKESPALSEAVIVHFDPNQINLKILIEIHLRTHSATSNHSLRTKYRSAVYVFDAIQHTESILILTELQPQFDKPLITQVLYFDSFKLNSENYLDYYYRNPEKPFCKNVIDPKLKILRAQFGNKIK
ncbi:MAG: peptide-methionine (S)-S-oxide reductase [Saprospiraceae bacterium]|nr:peptide-methionine (S)-S-oxide reductase [Saprospiraceae bacterium]